ncbi:MAG: hypothetical protein J6T98_09730 [Salinivirgaceae bacterium]|nr:hypothetical protein [Salinivirgaceae bacterium]
MNKKIVLAYVISAAVYIVTMLLMSARANTLLNEFANGFVEGKELPFSVLISIQKPHTTVNIIFFVALLGFALYLFAKGAKKAITYLPVLIFSVFTLFCYVSLSGAFYSIGGNNASLSKSYWLMFSMGIFFVVGAITITVIGSNAVRNLLKHKGNVEKN